MLAVNNGLSNETSLPVNNGNESLAPQKITAESWKSNSGEIFKYNNLERLAKQNEVVISDQDDKFFFIQHPDKINDVKEKANSLVGWKLHISVDPSHLEKTFDLVAPIISKYCPFFKVVNLKNVTSDRFLQGTQLTIYLEELERPIITAEQAEQMIKEINQVLSENKIPRGETPDSDAETISPYVSMRNDKYQALLKRHRVEYCPANAIGKNFNPLHYPNPFGSLLKASAKPFDPLEHFQSLAENTENTGVDKETLFYFTLSSYIREYTLFDTLDRTSQEKFLLEYCFWNGEKFNAENLKEPYRNNPEVLLAVKDAFALMLTYETDRCTVHSRYHHYVNNAQLSTHYPFNNSFKKFLISIESHSKNKFETYLKNIVITPRSLLESLKLSAAKTMEECSEKEVIEFVQKGNFYSAQTALKLLERCYEKEKYIKILHENDTVPAVQLELMRIHKYASPEKAAEYGLKFMASNSVDYVNIESDIGYQLFSIVVEQYDLPQLKTLSQSGNSLATITLAMIYGRDVLSNGGPPELKKFSDIPNHDLAKQYLRQLASNETYKKWVMEFDKKLLGSG